VKLWLFQNRLTGPLPPSWAVWDYIWDLSLNDNQLDGSVPQSWGRLGNTLAYLYLQNNTRLTGCLPSGLQRFQGRPETCASTKMTCSVCSSGGGASNSG
jgi:hypothetical protein